MNNDCVFSYRLPDSLFYNHVHLKDANKHLYRIVKNTREKGMFVSPVYCRAVILDKIKNCADKKIYNNELYVNLLFNR